MRAVALAVLLGVLGISRAAVAQTAANAALPRTTTVVTPETLQQVRSGLASPSAGVLLTDPFRFYSEVVATPPTFADYLKASDARLLMAAPELPDALTGPRLPRDVGNVDVLALIESGVHKFQQSRRAHEVRDIRARIDRELAALAGTQ